MDWIPVQGHVIKASKPALKGAPSGLIVPAAMNAAVALLPGPLLSVTGPFRIGPNCALIVMLAQGFPMPFVAYGGTHASDPVWAGPVEVQCHELPLAATSHVVNVAYGPRSELLELGLRLFAPNKIDLRLAVRLPGRTYINTGNSTAVVWPFWASLLAINSSSQQGRQLHPARVLEVFEVAEQTLVGGVNAQATVADEWDAIQQDITSSDGLGKWLDELADSCDLGGRGVLPIPM